MNPKCLGRGIPDTFSAKSADSTGLKMRRITRAVSFDHLVGDGKERCRSGEAERAGGFDIDDELKLRGLHHGQIRGLRALENATSISTDLTPSLANVASIAQEPARFGEVTY